MNTPYKKLIQFSSGTGPVECEWAVAKLIRLFYKDVEKKQIQYRVIESVLGSQPGTLKSVIVELRGNETHLNELVKSWTGVLQYIGKSKYRKFHKRKNWFIGVQETTDLQEIELKDAEIEYQAVRSRGAGGQNVNKVNTAVRATHIPTQTSVFVMDTRSQHENKKLAKERLRLKLNELNLQFIKDQINEKWRNHLDLMRGNPIRTFTENDL